MNTEAIKKTLAVCVTCLLAVGLLGTPALAQEQEGETTADTTVTETQAETETEARTSTAQTDTTDQEAMQAGDDAAQEDDMSAETQTGADSADVEVAGTETVSEETVALLRTVGNPLRRADMLVFVVPSLADTLNLTDQQVQQLDQLRSEFATSRAQTEQEIEDQQLALVEQLRGTNPPASELEGELQRIAELSVETQLSGYRTLQDMLDLLSPEQQQTVASLSPMAMQDLMMRNMTIMEARQMMEALQGDPAAMPSTMDGEGMPQNDAMQDGAMQENATGEGAEDDGMMDDDGMQDDGMMDDDDMMDEGMEEETAPEADTTDSGYNNLR